MSGGAPDDGASPVRKQLGIRLRGEGNLMRLSQALFRRDDLFNRIPIGDGPGKGRHYHVADNYRQGCVFLAGDSAHLEAISEREA